MERRNTGLVICSLVMAAHALWVGHLLGSLYFIAAFPWGWVAVAAWRGRMQLAWDMALTFLTLLLLSLLAISLTAGGLAKLAASGSLAYFPGVVSWACLLVYIHHLRNDEEQETGDGWDDAAIASVARHFLDDIERGMGPGHGQNNQPREASKTGQAA